MQLEGITWHAITLQAHEFDATKKLLIEVFALRPAVEEDGYTMFPMSNGTILELYAPEAIPAYGFNDCGIVFGFRVEDIEAASEELAEGGCELLGEITRIEDMNYAYRDFRGPDGRVYGINEHKK
jgi:predicted enzyme related to lactoylglutathione lyase